MSAGQDDVVDDDKTKTVNNAADANSDSKKYDAANAANATGGETQAPTTVIDEQNSPNSGCRVNDTLQTQNFAPYRENIVAKATAFLGALPVQYGVEKTFKFLRSKGLTDPEIQESIQRASAIRNRNQHFDNTNAPPLFDNGGTAVQTRYESASWFERLVRFTALSATVAYVAYKIYKKYIQIWLFGRKKSEFEKRFDSLEQTMLRFMEEQKNTNKSFDSIIQRHEIEQMKAELKSIKGLLLNKCQFPPAPPHSSLPNWQLPKSTKPQVEQPKIIGKAETPSLMQQNNKPNGVETPITVQPVNNTENKTNPTVKPNVTRVQEDRAAETPNSPQQSTSYDPKNSNNTSSD